MGSFIFCFLFFSPFLFYIFGRRVMSLSMAGRSNGNLKELNSYYLSLANEERGCLVLTSFPKAQENMIDVLSLDTAVVPW